MSEGHAKLEGKYKWAVIWAHDFLDIGKGVLDIGKGVLKNLELCVAKLTLDLIFHLS